MGFSRRISPSFSTVVSLTRWRRQVGFDGSAAAAWREILQVDPRLFGLKGPFQILLGKLPLDLGRQRSSVEVLHRQLVARVRLVDEPVERFQRLLQRRGFEDAGASDDHSPEVRDDRPVIVPLGPDGDLTSRQARQGREGPDHGEVQGAGYPFRDVEQPGAQRLGDQEFRHLRHGQEFDADGPRFVGPFEGFGAVAVYPGRPCYWCWIGARGDQLLDGGGIRKPLQRGPRLGIGSPDGQSLPPLNDIAAFRQTREPDDSDGRPGVELRQEADDAADVAFARRVGIGQEDDFEARQRRPVGFVG